MRSYVFILPLVLIFLCGSSVADEPHTAPTAFVHANVLPMDTEEVLIDYTVIVIDGRISAMGPTATTVIPPGVNTIDAKGAYLMPGLADMHAHLSGFDRRAQHLVLYLAEGVTTVRSLSGDPLNLEWRQKALRGEVVSPTIYTSGPTLFGLYGDELGMQIWSDGLRVATVLMPLFLGALGYWIYRLFRRLQRRREGHHGPATNRLSQRALWSSGIALIFLGCVLGWIRVIPVTPIGRVLYDAPWAYMVETQQQAVDEVRRQKAEGYDFVKLYDGLTEGQYDAVVNEARKIGMYVVGHAPNQIALEKLVASGQAEFAHMDELLSYHWVGYDPADVDASPNPSDGFPVNREMIPHTVSLLREHQISVVSNLVTDEMMYRLCLDTPGVLADPKYNVVPPALVEYWKIAGRNVRGFRTQGSYRKNIGQPFLQELAGALHSAGVILTVGVDASVEGMIPGYHIHRELELLVESGLTPYEALLAGTRNAGQVVARMGRDGNFGVIRVGNRADLMLLSKNPFENVSATRERMGVMVRGRWYAQADLDKKVDAWVEMLNDK